MKLHSLNIKNHESIPEKYAHCKLDRNQNICPSDNISPSFIFSNVTKEAASLALVCVDPDAPIQKLLGSEEMIVYDFPRHEFCHLLAVNIPPKLGMIAEGCLSENSGITLGLNDYPSPYHLGYSGPCPPANDQRIHRYRFSLLALDVKTLDTPATFHYLDVKTELEAHTLELASFVATYTLNPRLKRKQA